MKFPIHVCILTTAHPIDDVRVQHKFAHSFLSKGYRLSWVGPGRTFFDHNSHLSDNTNYVLSPPVLTRIDRLLSSKRIYKLAKTVSDVHVYYTPDSDAAPIALKLAQKNKAKVIFDIHEVFHGTLLDRYLLGLNLKSVRELLRKQISKTASKCDLVIGVSQSVLDPYVQNGKDSLIVRSCAPEWFANNEPATIHRTNKKHFRIMHGKSDLGRGTLKVVEAAAKVCSTVQNLKIAMFKFAHESKKEKDGTLYNQIQKLELHDKIELMHPIPMLEMPNILRTCDAGMIAYGRNLGIDSLPNRLFEYMAAGLAIIAPIYSREIANILNAEKCGILVDFEDPNDIARGIVELASNPHECKDMGIRAREAFLARHNWTTEIRPVLEIIDSWSE